MGFMDELKRLTQPYDDDDDFYEDSDKSFQSSQTTSDKPNANNSQSQFEDKFSSSNFTGNEPVKKKSTKPTKASSSGSPAGSIFGNFGESKKATANTEQNRPQSRPPRRRPSGSEQQVVLFNPKDFDEAGELVTYVSQGRSLVMALEGIPMDTARRLLDFISGICFAMNAKITPVSAKTYFITPENVDILDAQALQKNSQDEQDEF